MPVYFIQAADGTGPVKIGFTRDDPKKRLKSLQAGSPVPLKLLGIASPIAGTERDIHRQFAPYRMRNEWFQLCQGMLDMIIPVIRQPEVRQTQEDFRRSLQEPMPKAEFKRLLKCGRLTQRQAAADLGIHQSTMVRWPENRVPPIYVSYAILMAGLDDAGQARVRAEIAR